MTLRYYNTNPGLGYVPSYQVSAIPWLKSEITVPTTEPLAIEFGSVTRFVIITNTASSSDPNVPIRFGITHDGILGTNYLSLNNSESFQAEWKVIKLYLLAPESEGQCSIAAGLTDIQKNSLDWNWEGNEGV